MWSSAVLLFLSIGCSSDHVGAPAWRVGQWVEYDVTCRGKSWRLEYAIVSEERSRDSTLFWLEVRKFEEKDSLFVKFLVPAGLAGPPEKIVIGGNGMKSQLLLDGSRIASVPGGAAASVAVDRSASLEEVDTPAGKFASRKYGHDSGVAWLCPKVPIFGVVRSRGDDIEMVLAGYGLKGAASRLREAPELVAVP
jgi:hypothetical protein